MEKQNNSCVKCGYEWSSKDENIKPKSCPRCKTYKWEKKNE